MILQVMNGTCVNDNQDEIPHKLSKMKTGNYLILFLFGLMLTVGACNKDKETNPKKEILTAKSWKVSSYKINEEEIALMDCQTDNYLTFNTNGTYTDFVGDIKCSLSETNINGTWSLSDDEKILTLESYQGVQSGSIEITESKLVITITDDTDIIVMTCVPY